VARVIAVTNQKGGVGKTTTAVNLAACLAAAEKRTLLVDMDPQGNATSGFGISRDRPGPYVYEVLMGEAKASEALCTGPLPGLYILPSSPALLGAEVELANEVGREQRLKKALNGLLDEYTYILVDCPPSLGLLTLNALTAAHSVLIPLQCEYYALEGLSHLLTTLRLVRRGPALGLGHHFAGQEVERLVNRDHQRRLGHEDRRTGERPTQQPVGKGGIGQPAEGGGQAAHFFSRRRKANRPSAPTAPRIRTATIAMGPIT